MDARDKRVAEAVLRHLCQGAQIDGIRFGPILQILITDHSSSKTAARGQVYLNLASTWTVFDWLPDVFPDGEDDMLEMTAEEQIRHICDLRELIITKVELGESQPHLIMTLENGQVVFINGRHDVYECWQLGVAMGDPNEAWLVAACSGGGISIWAPENFNFADEQGQ